MNDILHEASALAEYWRKLYVRTGHVQYLRTAEVIATLRAAVIDKKIQLPADFSSQPIDAHDLPPSENERTIITS